LLAKFLEEFKAMFQQFTQQNSMMLHMISTLTSKFTKFLRIVLWNANGLLKHKKELEIFLQHYFIDIMLISETHFTDRSYFNIAKYLTYSTNHPDNMAHGGTAILIQNNHH
jgi:hypothetical protein